MGEQERPQNAPDTLGLAGLTALREPFPEGQIDKLPRGISKGAKKESCKVCGGYHEPAAVHLDYVGHARATERLLDVDPLWNWEPVAFDEQGLPALARDGSGTPIGLWIRLQVCGVTRIGFGELPAHKGPDGIKEAIGDAIRNAAMRFGVALDLWMKEERAAPKDEQGRAKPSKKAAKPKEKADPITEEQTVAIVSEIRLRREQGVTLEDLLAKGGYEKLEDVPKENADKMLGYIRSTWPMAVEPEPEPEQTTLGENGWADDILATTEELDELVQLAAEAKVDLEAIMRVERVGQLEHLSGAAVARERVRLGKIVADARAKAGAKGAGA